MDFCPTLCRWWHFEHSRQYGRSEALTLRYSPHKRKDFSTEVMQVDLGAQKSQFFSTRSAGENMLVTNYICEVK